MRVEDEYVKTGYFWLPEQEEKKVPGVLTIKNGGDIELEIVGLFDDSIESFNDDNDLGRIIGHVERDGPITLENCFYITKNISLGGISKSKVCVNTVLSGVAFGQNEAVTFNSLSFSVDCLDEWIGVTGIRVKSDWKSRTANISYAAPDNICYVLDGGMRLEICFVCILPDSSKTTEAKVTQRVHFKLSSEELKPLMDYTEIAYKLTNFLCFAIDTTVTLKRMSATSDEIQKELESGGRYAVPVKIFYKSIPFIEKVPDKSWHRMLFTYPMIKNNAEDVFNNWLRAYDVMTPALNLYFSTQNGTQKYLESNFLALAQGLETYHRRTSDEQLMESSDFDKLVLTIIEHCPEDHAEWLNGRLKYGNEINLGTRLKRIIEPFKEKLGNGKERKKLLRKIVETRNYLTHYSENLKHSVVEGQELWVICQKMEAIFQLHLLKVIGFTDKEIENVINSCYSLKQKISKT